MLSRLVVINAGRLEYERAVRLQERLVERVWADPTTEYLLMCEHPRLITLGRSASDEHVLLSGSELSRRGIEVHESSRGGDVTYHGPGQLVGYPIINLHLRKLGIRDYLRKLEEVIIRALRSFGIESGRDPDYTGVWVGSEKICAIGVAVRRWITYHGFALNVTTDMRDFEMIRPCGIPGRGVTSMEKVLSERGGVKTPSMEAVRAALSAECAEVFPVDEVTEEADAQRFIDGRRRFPPWLKKRLPTGAGEVSVRQLLAELKLETVCASAVCPNQCECFGRGTATFMILGNVCTRNCRFCAIAHGEPTPVDADEPNRVAQAVATLKLKHVVVTSVTRDDLSDGGAGQFAATINAIRRTEPKTTVEVLTPDFGGDESALQTVLDARPDVFNHNVETVERLYSRVRPGARYERSLGLLSRAKSLMPDVVVKSGLMVGMGETREELTKALSDVRRAGVEALTVGQYLSPTREHHPVIRFVPPEEFADVEREALRLGFAAVACGPFVRSSYQADELLERVRTVAAD